jgi:hypothetical protein
MLVDAERRRVFDAGIGVRQHAPARHDERSKQTVAALRTQQAFRHISVKRTKSVVKIEIRFISHVFDILRNTAAIVDVQC